MDVLFQERALAKDNHIVLEIIYDMYYIKYTQIVTYAAIMTNLCYSFFIITLWPFMFCQAQILGSFSKLHKCHSHIS